MHSLNKNICDWNTLLENVKEQYELHHNVHIVAIDISPKIFSGIDIGDRKIVSGWVLYRSNNKIVLCNIDIFYRLIDENKYVCDEIFGITPTATFADQYGSALWQVRNGSNVVAATNMINSLPARMKEQYARLIVGE